jgi:aminoglycoside phosphotransferase (APT) family kinase protein
MTTGDHSQGSWAGRWLAQASTETTKAAWGFQNRTDIVTLADGDRVVLQRYRRRQDAEYRLRMMGALRDPAAAVGIAIPQARTFDLDADPPWVIFDALPGVPVPALDDDGLEGPRFSALARAMGEMLRRFRQLPIDGLEIDRTWADPTRLVARAVEWASNLRDLSGRERAALDDLLRQVPDLFDRRTPGLAHGDFSPVNVLSDGRSLTGLVDFESVRLADPLFDVAWWEWSVSFSSPAVLKTAWPEFLRGVEIEANDPELLPRVRSLQMLRMLELLAGDSVAAGIRSIVADRLRASLRR